MEIHRIHPELLERQVRVLVVGCGGTGSAVVAGLPYLHQSLMAHGHPGGLSARIQKRRNLNRGRLAGTRGGSPLVRGSVSGCGVEGKFAA